MRTISITLAALLLSFTYNANSAQAASVKLKTLGYLQVEDYGGKFERVEISPVIRLTPGKNKTIKFKYVLFDKIYTRTLHWSGDRFLYNSKQIAFESHYENLKDCTGSSIVSLYGRNFSINTTIACKDEAGETQQQSRVTTVLRIGKAIK